MTRAIRLGLYLVKLAAIAAALALLLVPALAIGANSTDFCTWPRELKQILPVMAAAFFCALVALDLVVLLLCPIAEARP